MQVTIKLAPDILATEARLYIAVKETNGVINWVKLFVFDKSFFLLFADYVKDVTLALILPRKM